MVSFYRKARDGSKQIGFAAVAGEMLDRLIDEEARLLPCAFLAEQRDERRLARIGVAPGRLAGSRLAPAMVDQVVGDLEGKADIACIAAVRGAPLRRHSNHNARGLDRIFDQCPGLELL